MPKSEVPSVARRSARIASAGSGPAVTKEEAKPVAKKVAPAKKEAVKSDKAVKSKDTKATKSKTKSKDDNPSTLETAVATAEQAMETVVAAVEPAVESVVAAVEPAVEAVVDAVEPVVDAVESAVAPASKGSNKGKPKSKDSAGDKAATASANRGVLQLGSGLPKIVLKNEDGEDVDVSTLGGERGVVIFLYPRADTPGCTNQACGFRDLNAEIGELGYTVYGLSKDTPTAQLKWKTKKALNYHLLSDPESKLIKRLGAFILPNNTKRSHFIFEKGTGKLIDIALGVKPADDPKNTLKFLKEHHK